MKSYLKHKMSLIRHLKSHFADLKSHLNYIKRGRKLAEKNQLDQIQNGRASLIWLLSGKLVDSHIITLKQVVVILDWPPILPTGRLCFWFCWFAVSHSVGLPVRSLDYLKSNERIWMIFLPEMCLQPKNSRFDFGMIRIAIRIRIMIRSGFHKLPWNIFSRGVSRANTIKGPIHWIVGMIRVTIRLQDPDYNN